MDHKIQDLVDKQACEKFDRYFHHVPFHRVSAVVSALMMAQDMIYSGASPTQAVVRSSQEYQLSEAETNPMYDYLWSQI